MTSCLRIEIECLSPLVHGAFGGDTGNAVMIRRMPIVSLPGMPRVPVVSGNAIRGALRRVVMRELFDTAGLTREHMEPKRWDRLYAALVNGGHLTGSETRVDPTRYRELREALPPLSVFGAALYTYMLPGHMSVGIAWPVCAETVTAGMVVVPDSFPAVRAEDLVDEVSHCRHIEREYQDAVASGVTPMPTTMEAIATGTRLQSQIRFAGHATPCERGAVYRGLHALRALGGKSSAGMGLVTVTQDVTYPGQRSDDIDAYEGWLAQGAHVDALQSLAAELG